MGTALAVRLLRCRRPTIANNPGNVFRVPDGKMGELVNSLASIGFGYVFANNRDETRYMPHPWHLKT